MFITPNPKSYTQNEERFCFENELFVCYPEKAIKAEYIPILTELFSHYTAERTTARFVESKTLPQGVCILSKCADATAEERAPEGEYELSVTKDGAVIRFSAYDGLFHGLSGFLQLIRPDDTGDTLTYYVRGCEVKDEPKMNFRAVHFCVFHQTTLDFLKKNIMLCGMMKCTHIVLEFWGMYHYRCCPNLSWKDAYTDNDIRPLILLANAMGMEVIPMLNHLGHASGGRIHYGKHSALDTDLAMAPYFEDDGWCWCTSNPKTLALLAACRRELIELCGEGKYFHIGFDEAYSFGQCDRCRKYDPHLLMKEHLLHTCEDLISLGRRPIMWADMMLDVDKFDPEKYFLSSSAGKDFRGELPKELIMADWQYRTADEDFKTSFELANDGFDVVTCPWDFFENVHAAAQTVRDGKLYGMIATTWHTLKELIWLIPYAGDEMWGSAEDHGRFRGEYYSLCAAYNIRRCVPSEGHYERAATWDKEINY